MTQSAQMTELPQMTQSVPISQLHIVYFGVKK